MINALSIALSGLTAATTRVNAATSNIANAFTAGYIEDPDNAPYTPIDVQQTAQTVGEGPAGTRAEFTARDPAFVPSFDPDSPFANEDGIIGAPNVDLAEETVNLLLAETSYKANLEVIETTDELSDELFRIFDEEA